MECSCCMKKSDTYIKGFVIVDHAARRVVICSTCLAVMTQALLTKYKKLPPPEKVEWEAWSTATDES